MEQADKLVKEKVVKMLELCQFLVKRVHQQVGVCGGTAGTRRCHASDSRLCCCPLQKLSVDLEPLQKALQTLPTAVAFSKTGKLEDTYWAVMKHFGVA